MTVLGTQSTEHREQTVWAAVVAEAATTVRTTLPLHAPASRSARARVSSLRSLSSSAIFGFLQLIE